MPSLPVRGGVAIACAMLLGLSAPAHARVAVRAIQDLLVEKEVTEAGAAFDDQVKGAFTYTHCAQTLGITPEQQEYQKAMYESAAKAFADAFYTTYMRKTGIAPEQKVVDSYARYIENRQQQQVNALQTELNTRRGCLKTTFRMIYRNTEKLHQQQLLDAKNKNEIGKRYDPWKAPKPVAPAAPPVVSQQPAPVTTSQPAE